MPIQKLSSFISSERNRFSIQHDNMFASSFSQAINYYGFLLIISKRYKDASKSFIANFKEFQSALDKSPNSHPMTQKQPDIQLRGMNITNVLHLEIESFYLFAKIFLDKICRALELYFGPARGLSLDSHDLLSKNLVKYASDKGLVLNENILFLVNKLKTEISDFRDYQITHHKNSRTTRGTMFGPTGEIRMLLTSVYPKPEDKQIESKNLKELLELIDIYIDEVVYFLKTNNKKTNLRLDTK